MVSTESGPHTAVVVRIAGELDLASRDAIEPAILAAIASSAGGVIVDLGELTFCDSQGVAMFEGFVEKAKAAGTDLRLRHVLPPVRRVFEILGFDGQIQIID
jgi:anti-anti-sigma factor